MKTVYICDYCGMEFTDYTACLDHEYKAHLKPRHARAVKYGTDNPKYPEVLHVEMPDDAVVEYTYSRMVEPANEAEEVA